jgi:hypothetical protein
MLTAADQSAIAEIKSELAAKKKAATTDRIARLKAATRKTPELKLKPPITVTQRLAWHGLELRAGKRVVATLVPEAIYRVRLPNGHTTDILNRTRAADVAVALVEGGAR